MAFLAIDVDPSEDAELVRDYAEQQGYPWPIALYDPQIVADYRITSQASKVVIDAEGVIAFRGGYGTEKPETWRRVLEEVASGAR